MKIEQAVFAGGCFWCTEAVFNLLKGVRSVESGYTGGQRVNPSYEQVCTGATGHAEAIRITYDASTITYEELLDVHFASHNPTELNRQGNDIGTQYRSAIFPLEEQQAIAARAAIKRHQAYQPRLIVTSVEPFKTWYPAEKIHQNYWNGEGKNNGYCLAVIPPKLNKIQRQFTDKLKTGTD